jgi:hypothetical protein
MLYCTSLHCPWLQKTVLSCTVWSCTVPVLLHCAEVYGASLCCSAAVLRARCAILCCGAACPGLALHGTVYLHCPCTAPPHTVLSCAVSSGAALCWAVRVLCDAASCLAASPHGVPKLFLTSWSRQGDASHRREAQCVHYHRVCCVLYPGQGLEGEETNQCCERKPPSVL